jgi:beta-lactamase regulating signal transducer with metallopeptidase domain
MKRLFVEEAYQQPIVNVTNILGDIGLVVVLIALAALMVWRLIDLFKKNGRWSKEIHEKLESYVEEN